MVFQKRARKCTEYRFYIDNQVIDVVSLHQERLVTLDHLKEKLDITPCMHSFISNLSNSSIHTACQFYATLKLLHSSVFSALRS